MAKKKAKKPVKKAVKKKAVKKPVKKAAKTPAAKRKTASTARAVSEKPAAAVVKKTNIINPYLNFNGNCEEAFNFYKSVFGGEFGYTGRYREMPPMDGKTVTAEEAEKIMHISLPISKDSILMGSDTSTAFGPPVTTGNNFAISISASSKAEADRLFNGLSAGGKVIMPMDNAFWGSYFGMLTDKFDINWMVSFDQGMS